jgi:hypothetical protein
MVLNIPARVLQMHRLLVAAGLATALTSSQAQALDFSFSFFGTIGTTTGTVSGEIFGLANNATSAATDLVIDSLPPSFGFATPYDMFPTTPAANFFTVSNGVIIDGQFGAFDPTHTFEFGLNFATQNVVKDPAGATTYNNLGFAGATYSAVAVREPVSWALLISGIAGLRLLRRRRET